MEIWKEISGYEDTHKISSLGNIQISKTGKLATLTRQDEYLTVSLSKNGTKTHLVNRLVAEVFLGISDKMVNHKDGNKSNNNIENLEYVTASENIRHAITVLHKKTKFTEEKISEIIKLFKQGYTSEYLSEKFNISKSAINRMLSGKSLSYITNIKPSSKRRIGLNKEKAEIIKGLFSSKQ